MCKAMYAIECRAGMHTATAEQKLCQSRTKMDSNDPPPTRLSLQNSSNANIFAEHLTSIKHSTVHPLTKLHNTKSTLITEL